MAVAQNCRTEKFHPKQTQRLSAKIWGIERRRIYGAAGRVILPRMTRHKHAQTGLVTPQLPQHWLTAALRAFAMLVLNVASTLQMISRRAAVNATQATPTDLPRAATDTHQETTAAQQSSSIALILRSAAKLRVSKDEGVLTTPSVSHAPRAIHLPHTTCGGGKQRTVAGNEGELPPPVRSTGGGGLRALARKTEGAHAISTAAPPPSGGGAKRAIRWSAKIRWGTALTHLADHGTRQTAPHPHRARATTCARTSSPARGRIKPALN
jgi:hypothetical protein